MLLVRHFCFRKKLGTNAQKHEVDRGPPLVAGSVAMEITGSRTDHTF